MSSALEVREVWVLRRVSESDSPNGKGYLGDGGTRNAPFTYGSSSEADWALKQLSSNYVPVRATLTIEAA